MRRKISVGDPIIFVVTKNTTHPGPRAKHVRPARAGETYSYQIEKFWTVAEVHSDERLLLITRRGKQHLVMANDLRLRPARWWEKWFYQSRFPALNTTSERMAIRLN
jgi:hypothetical protein